MDQLAVVLTAGGGKLNRFGDLEVTIKKGLLSKKEEKHTMEFGVIKGTKTIGAFFALRTDHGMNTIMTIHFMKEKGKLSAEWTCHDSRYSKLCDEILKILKKGLKEAPSIKGKRRVTGSQEVDRKSLLRLSELYSAKLDGFAEVTLATALLRYPLIMKFEDKVENMLDIEDFLERFAARVGKGRYIITVSGDDWRFIIGFNTETGEFTPSFVSWSGNERYLGEEAIVRFKKIKPDTKITVMAFSVPEHM